MTNYAGSDVHDECKQFSEKIHLNASLSVVVRPVFCSKFFSFFFSNCRIDKRQVIYVRGLFISRDYHVEAHQKMENSGYFTFQIANNKGADQTAQAVLPLCCSQATKSGFLASRPI